MWSVSINRSSKEAPFTFLDLQALQNEAISHARDSLIFAEVEPVVTLGQRQVLWSHDSQNPTAASSTFDELKKNLATKNIMLVPGDRGGNETWHGPGQWVCFVVTRLETWVGDAKGVRKAVCQVLNRILPVVQELEPLAHIEDGDRMGIWTPQGKLVSIGIKIQNGWMKSGFAINLIPTPESFYGIHPCGIVAAVPDFLFNNRVKPEIWEEQFKAFPQKLKNALVEA